LAGQATGAATAAPLATAQNTTQRLSLDHIELISVVGFHSVSVSEADRSFVDGLHRMSVPLIKNLNTGCVAAKINGCMAASVNVVSVPAVRVECCDNRSCLIRFAVLTFSPWCHDEGGGMETTAWTNVTHCPLPTSCPLREFASAIFAT
jgi:hypothetical protein